MGLKKRMYILLFPLLSYVFSQQITACEIIRVSDHNNNHPLHFLFSSRLDEEDIQKTQLILTQGAQPNITHYCNNSLLHSIIEKSEDHDRTCTFAQILCEHKADINAKNDTKETPLILAIKKGNEQLVKLLLEQGANPNVEDQCGDHTIHIAMEWDTEQENPLYKKRKILPNIVMLLLQYKADPNKAYRFKGARPLHAAVFHNAPTVVQALLSCGAHKNVYDERGFTPLSLAKKYQYTNIINMFSIDEAIKSFHLIAIETSPSNTNTDKPFAETTIIDENKDKNKKIVSYQHAPPTLITVDEEIKSFHIMLKKTPFTFNTDKPFNTKTIVDDYLAIAI
jgi:ankyrin repeat protein